MSVTVPNQTVAITRNDLPTPDFRRWQLAITDAVNNPAAVTPVEPVTGDYLPLSTYVRGVGGIAWTGTLEMGGVLLSLESVADSGTGALLGITRDAYGRVSGTTDATITGTAGQIAVANGDAVAGPPTLSLADVADAGGGTLQKTAFDAKGRMSGTSAATTSDLAEGANLYFTDGRAQAAVVAPTITPGDTTHAPSGDAVNTALAAKADSATTLAGYGITDAMATSWTLTAGNGLTGGGSGAANRTVALGTPGSLTNSTTNAVTATSHTHDVTLSYLFNADERTTNTIPSDYTDRGLSVAFNSGANLGTPGSFGMSLHLAPWNAYDAAYKQHQLNFAGDGSAFYWRTATSDTTWGPAYKVHTDASTDINAATLGGLSATAASTGSTIVARDGSGDMFARLFRSEYASTGGAINYLVSQVALGTGADNYLRPQTIASVATALLADGQIGYRNVPLTTTNANYTFVADDAGKGRMHTDATARTYTLPPSVFSVGDVLTVVNYDVANITIARGTGVALYIAGVSGGSADRTVGPRGVATIICIGVNAFFIGGPGVF